MKRMRSMLFAALVLLSAAGCCAPDAAFVKAADGYADAILPEYEAYVKADATLSESTKKIRLDSAAGLRRLLEAATPPNR